jgi:flagellar basal-body rod protein FlgF
MDRLIHTVGNALTNLVDTQRITAQNLSNLSVPGYRRDLPGEGSSVFLRQIEALDTRAFQVAQGHHGFSQEPGFIDRTDEPLDIAIPDAGFLYVQPANGEPALTRRGDLRVDTQGRLVNGAGEALLDTALAPIVLPPYRDVVIDEIGQISVMPMDGGAGDRVVVATLASAVPAATAPLRKGLDGHIRLAGGGVPAPDQQARIVQGALERSNVNPTGELIASIEQQRGFELNIRMISEAKAIDEAASRLLRLPEG